MRGKNGRAGRSPELPTVKPALMSSHTHRRDHTSTDELICVRPHPRPAMVDPPPLPASAGGTRAVTTSDDASSAGATHKHSSRKTATSADSTDREIASAATTNQTSTDPTSTNPAAAGPPADLARLLIRDPGHTVLLRVAGASMQGAGIQHGDLLVVDCRRRARAGQVVVALLEGGFTLKRLAWRDGRWWLDAAHPAYPALVLGEGRIWGVALHAIRALHGIGARRR